MEFVKVRYCFQCQKFSNPGSFGEVYPDPVDNIVLNFVRLVHNVTGTPVAPYDTRYLFDVFINLATYRTS